LPGRGEVVGGTVGNVVGRLRRVFGSGVDREDLVVRAGDVESLAGNLGAVWGPNRPAFLDTRLVGDPGLT